MNLNESCPEEILKCILRYIDCRRSQCNAALTCTRWRTILSNPSAHIDDQVEKLEIYQNSLVDQLMNSSRSISHVIHLQNFQILHHFSNYIGTCNRLTVHGQNEEFVRNTLDAIQNLDKRAQNLEICIYSNTDLNLNTILERFPNTKALVIRSMNLIPDQPMPQIVITAAPAMDRININRIRFHRVQISDDFDLPESITWVEYTPIFSHTLDQGFLTKLATFHSITKLTIGYATFNEAIFKRLLLIIRYDLPRLIMLKFESIAFSNIDFGSFDRLVQSERGECGPCVLRSLDFSSCLNIAFDRAVWAMVKSLGVNLKKITLTVELYFHANLADFYALIQILRDLECELEVRICDPTNYAQVFDPPPLQLADVMGKLELEKFQSSQYIGYMISCGVYSKLTDLCFERCPGFQDDHVENIAQFCPQLRSLLISRCENVHGQGFAHFLHHWDTRKSRILNLYWENYEYDPDDDSSPMEKFYASIRNDDSMKDKRITKFWKRAGDCRLVIWETDQSDQKSKRMIIRDYLTCTSRIERFSID